MKAISLTIYTILATHWWKSNAGICMNHSVFIFEDEKAKAAPPRIWMKWWIKWSLEALTKQQNRIRLEKFRQSPQNMKELSKQQAYKWPTFQSNNVRWMGNTGSTSTTANVWNVSDNRQSSCCPVLMGGYVDFSYNFSFDHLVRSKCPMLFHSVEKSFGENLIRNFLWSRIK